VPMLIPIAPARETKTSISLIAMVRIEKAMGLSSLLSCWDSLLAAYPDSSFCE
jgi:hypothetical protein